MWCLQVLERMEKSQALKDETCLLYTSLVSQEDVPHVFDRFYTGDQTRSGHNTGIGLAIVKRLAEPVSYTHLDVYKRQEFANIITLLLGITISFSMRAEQFVTLNTLMIIILGLFESPPFLHRPRYRNLRRRFHSVAAPLCRSTPPSRPLRCCRPSRGRDRAQRTKREAQRSA